MVCDLLLLAVLGDAGWHTISPFRGPKGGTGSQIRRWIRPYSSVCLVGMRIAPRRLLQGFEERPDSGVEPGTRISVLGRVRWAEDAPGGTRSREACDW